MSQTMNMMTDMAMQSVRHNNLDNERSKLNNISKSSDNALKEKELRKAAEGFEAIFIQKMWDEMRSSLPKNGMHYSKEEEYWQSMYSQELGKSMASAGGIGLADMMVEQLTRPTVSSPQTGTLSRVRMAVEPAPLIPKENLKETKTEHSASIQHSTKPFTSSVQNQPQLTMPQNIYEEFNPQEAVAITTALNSVQNQQTSIQVQEQQTQNIQTQQEIQQAQIVQQNPQVIRTTYITNLPPEKRSHAILDRKGNPIKKTEVNYIENTSQQLKNTEFHVPTQVNRNSSPLAINNVVETSSVNNFTVNTQVPQKANQPNETLEQSVFEQPHDILAGISTTYIPYHQRMAERMAQTVTIAQHSQEKHSELVAPVQNIQTSRSFKLPTLEEALKMGTLIASISDEEIATVQAKQSNSQSLNTVTKNTHATATHNDKAIQHTKQANNISALAPKTEFQMPVQGAIQSSFGWRLNPVSHQREWHKGIDIETTNTVIQASKAGTVTFAGKDSRLGNMLVLDHGNGLESVYSHTGDLLVTKGDIISSGTQIAKTITGSGVAQNSNTSHLHFEIRQNGLSINPEPYFSKEEIS